MSTSKKTTKSDFEKVKKPTKKPVSPKIKEESIEKTQTLLTAEEKQELKDRLYANRKDSQSGSERVEDVGNFGNKMYMTLETRIMILVALVVVFAGLGAFSIVRALDNTTTHGFFYNETSSLDYRICLVENDYFNDRCLGPDVTQYVASLIDYVEAEFKYNFDASDLIDYEYTYHITARLIATEKNAPDKVLIDELEQLTEPQTVTMEDSSGFLLNEELIIDYGRYNNIMVNFRRDYALLFDSNIIIELHVSVQGNNARIVDDISSEQTMSMTIPLSEQTINIEVDYEGVNDHKYFESEDTNVLVTGLFYLLALVCFLVVADILIKIYKLVSRVSFNKSTYKKTLDKIMREYGQVIVETNTIPDVPKEKIYKIISFEEIIDLHTVLQKPILFMKIHNEKSCFMISDGDDNYQYIMKASDLEKKKK